MHASLGWISGENSAHLSIGCQYECQEEGKAENLLQEIRETIVGLIFNQRMTKN